jgi:hypothetical protein
MQYERSKRFTYSQHAEERVVHVRHEENGQKEAQKEKKEINTITQKRVGM